jgi:ABC-2 type transport system ATP-binding protein
MVKGRANGYDKNGIGPYLIEMNDASLVFGNGNGIFNINLQLRPGTILGLIGPSGSGKTTTIRMLTGIYEKTGGEVRVFGSNPREFSDAEKSRIGYIPQHFLMYQNLSVEENLNFMGGMYGSTPRDHKEQMDYLLEFFELDAARRRLGRHLSGGMQRRLMLAGGLLHKPELIFADEPTAGIDPILREKTWEHFRYLKSKERSLLVTTQYVGEAAYCDVIAVMRKGKLIKFGTPKKLRKEAMGGEIVHLQIEPQHVFQVMEFLDKLPKVKKVEQVEGKKDQLFVYTRSASKEIPNIINALRENLNITPKKVEPYLPPFDEVFVRLIKQTELM